MDTKSTIKTNNKTKSFTDGTKLKTLNSNQTINVMGSSSSSHNNKMGTVEGSGNKKHPSKARVSPAPRRPVLGLHVPVRAEGEATCEITGCAVLSPDRAVVVDNWNQSVKVVSTNPSSPGVLLHRKLDGRPFDVTIVPGDKMAVTIPEKNKIIFTSTQTVIDNRKELEAEHPLQKSLGKGSKCYGIHYEGGFLFVAVQAEKPKVLMMAFEGEEVREFSHEAMEDPRYLTVIGSEIFVSNSERIVHFSYKTQAKRTEETEEKETLTIALISEKNPKGIVAFQNKLMICSEGKGDIHINTFAFLSLSLFRRVVLQQDRPLGICYCPDRGVIYVSKARVSGNSANFLTACRI
ncbi:hypothetical protein MAR_000784 [Mya arenaria]|uniref:Uncharacterized protein n=1 Tax=Mya arenaria TaxID=6604 RepID=A0ABY7FD90_MYAAR|nr:hypothetical protein MAR_000784 [Mya arenaria]